MNNQLIAINGLTIKTDSEGRYCLNDLHKAAGGADHQQPAFFMRREETAELVAELSNSAKSQSYAPVISRPGRYGGTFVVKELVYAYAMWISPAFHLKVIRTFDKLQTQGVAVADHAVNDFFANPMKYMEALMTQAKAKIAEEQAKNAALTAEVKVRDEVIAAQAPAVEVVNILNEQGGTRSLRAAAFALNMRPSDFTAMLHEWGWLQRLNHTLGGIPRKVWLGTAYSIKAGYIKTTTYQTEYRTVATNAVVTDAGLVVIGKRLARAS